MKRNVVFSATFYGFMLYLLSTSYFYSNNILVSNVALTGQNTVSDFTQIRFDVSWENSWKTSTFESNWDAAWIFVKYRKKTENEWYHAYLNNTGHTPPVNGTLVPGLVTTNAPFNMINNPAVGVFVHRNSDGIGTINFSNIHLQWNYGANGLEDSDSVEVCVFAIEMVYIPSSPFFLGDNVLPGTFSSGHFTAGTTSNPFLVVSEAALTIGNTATSELWGASTSGTNTIGPAGTLPPDFPKGFQSFYIMKYELSQNTYKEYLNKLSRVQQAARVSATTPGIFMRNNNTTNTPSNRIGIKVMSDPGGNLPRVYGNDLNNNNVEGEAADGQYIPCGWLNFDDLRAFADWSGLRPYTELEFEKTCRGPLTPIANEYAWGNTNVTYANSIINQGLNNELPGNAGANCAYNNAAGVQGPLRSGAFAGAATNRQQAGATYYGVMEMSGNLWEYCVSVGKLDNRNFNGNNHGDGSLTLVGAPNVPSWPAEPGVRGGQWANNTTTHQVSDRSSAATTTVTRNYWGSIRLARTQP